VAMPITRKAETLAVHDLQQQLSDGGGVVNECGRGSWLRTPVAWS
jgi:hypothetical protein